MPELPEVETVKRGLEPALAGRVVVRVELRRKDLRFPFPPDFSERLQGARIESLSRRAKYILADTDRGDRLILHLGMTGRFTILRRDGSIGTPGEFYDSAAAKGSADSTHDHVVFHLDDQTRIVYSDPRRFGMMDLERAGEAHPLLRDLGVEPLGNGLSADYLRQAFTGKKAPLKAALLDQRIIAGLGNIYVCEALFRSRLSPRRKAGTISKRNDLRSDELVRHIRDILTEAIAAGGSTLQDYQSVDGTKGEFQERFLVYDREGGTVPCTGLHVDGAPSCTIGPLHLLLSNLPTLSIMNQDTIITEIRGKVGIITLNRPKALNALNGQLITEMNAALDRFDADSNIGCIILTGSEKAFAAGADIREMKDKTFAEVTEEDFLWDWDHIIHHPQTHHCGGGGLLPRRRL